MKKPKPKPTDKIKCSNCSAKYDSDFIRVHEPNMKHYLEGKWLWKHYLEGKWLCRQCLLRCV